MQNHNQFQSSYSNYPSTQISSPKYQSNNAKTFDKTLPSQPIKHHQSNPNFSFQFNQQRPQPQKNTQVPTFNKLKQYKPIPKVQTLPTSTSSSTIRPFRNPQMPKSLIVSQNERQQLTQSDTGQKKQFFRNKRAYRMSQTIEDLNMMQKKQQLNSTPFSSLNFLKARQVEKEVQLDESSPTTVKQIRPPTFISRNAEMKRSLILQPTFQAKYSSANSLRQSAKTKRKVTVQNFIKIKQLGNGKYGRVYLVRQKYSGFIGALKVLEKKLLEEQQITDQFIREIKIQMFLNHPNIIKMYGFFDDASNIYILLEVGTGGQLYHQLKKSQPLPQNRVAMYMKQVCEAVNQIHSLRIIHRDIKPQNIVLHDNIIKLCDFGWSVHQDNKLRTTFCGTPLYVCPQILKGRQYDEKIDIWSIGIMMYEMVVGENPFKISKQQQLIKIVKDEIKIPSYLYVSHEVRDFLDKCLQKNPDQRASIKQLLHHAFFAKHQNQQKNKLI